MQTQPICCGSRAEGRTGEAGSAGLHLWSLVVLHSCDAMGTGSKDLNVTDDTRIVELHE